MAVGLFVLPKMHKITQNSLLKKHGIFCLTFSSAVFWEILLAIHRNLWYTTRALCLGVLIFRPVLGQNRSGWRGI